LRREKRWRSVHNRLSKKKTTGGEGGSGTNVQYFLERGEEKVSLPRWGEKKRQQEKKKRKTLSLNLLTRGRKEGMSYQCPEKKGRKKGDIAI